jgi:hypothetical protein
MFQIFRRIFAAQLSKRFKLDTTPSSHVMLALQMNPSLNVSVDGPLLLGKSAFFELMGAVYRRALKRQAVLIASAATSGAPAPAPAPARPQRQPQPQPQPPRKQVMTKVQLRYCVLCFYCALYAKKLQSQKKSNFTLSHCPLSVGRRPTL